MLRDDNWCNLPYRRDQRWILPTRPSGVARAAVALYQPVTWSAIAGWNAARLAAGLGAFRFLPHGDPPPTGVIDALQPHLKGGSSLAVARTNHPGRYIALLIGSDGRCRSFAKVETLDHKHHTLSREAHALEKIAPLLPPPLSAPRVLAFQRGVLLLEAVTWFTRARPWRLTEEVAFAMGKFYAAESGLRPGHGDFAPWNLFRTATGWVVVDWEEATTDTPAFFDMLHYIVQAHALLGRPSARVLLDGLDGRGWVGAALLAYAKGAGVDAADARPALTAYLERSSTQQNREAADGRRGLRARKRLLAELTR